MEDIRPSIQSVYPIDALIMDRLGALPDLPTIFNWGLIRTIRDNPRDMDLLKGAQRIKRYESCRLAYVGENLVTFEELIEPNASVTVTVPGLVHSYTYIPSERGRIPIGCEVTFTARGAYLGILCTRSDVFDAGYVTSKMAELLVKSGVPFYIYHYDTRNDDFMRSSAVVELFLEDRASPRERLDQAYMDARGISFIDPFNLSWRKGGR